MPERHGNPEAPHSKRFFIHLPPSSPSAAASSSGTSCRSGPATPGTPLDWNRDQRASNSAESLRFVYFLDPFHCPAAPRLWWKPNHTTARPSVSRFVTMNLTRGTVPQMELQLRHHDSLDRGIAELLTGPVGGPSYKPVVGRGCESRIGSCPMGGSRSTGLTTIRFSGSSYRHDAEYQKLRRPDGLRQPKHPRCAFPWVRRHSLSVTMGAYGRLHLGHKHGRPSVQSLRPGYSYRAWPMPSLYHRHELGRSNTSIAV
jgi:hypothetical protein